MKLWRFDQFQRKTMRVHKLNENITEPFALFGFNTVGVEPRAPVINGARWDRKCNRCHNAGAGFAARQVFPWEKSNNRSRCAGRIPVIQMVGVRIVKIDGLFYQSQA